MTAADVPREESPEQLVNEANGNFCRFVDGELRRPFDAEPPDTLTTFVHDSFRALVLNPHFSCVGARSAVTQNAYGFGLYNEMGSESSSVALAGDLKRFIEDAALREHPFTAFVASFIGPVPATEEEFEAVLWSTLQQLSDVDHHEWSPARGDDPESPTFGFSFGGEGFFVVGLHAGSSRIARRFAFPTLVFNPHEQFDRLRSAGKFARFRDVVRARDIELQGALNPMLRDFGEGSEARQYSGRAVGSEWRCPFAHHAARGEDEA
jgi:FPC/CPF motif-containing protein YcgG